MTSREAEKNNAELGFRRTDATFLPSRRGGRRTICRSFFRIMVRPRCVCSNPQLPSCVSSSNPIVHKLVDLLSRRDLLVTANVFLLSLPTNLYPARYNENSDETTTLGTSPQAGSRGCGSAENAAKGERGDIEVSPPSLSVL